MGGRKTVDPTSDIQDELEKCLANTTRLSQRLNQTGLSRHERQWIESELKKSVRALYWAVEDYQHTLSVLSLDTSKFQLTYEEKVIRSNLLLSAKAFADDIRLNVLRTPIPSSESIRVLSSMASGSGSYKYSLLNDQDLEDEASSSSGANTGRFEDILLKQQQILRDQDDDLEVVGHSVKTLKHMSYRIGDELDQQAIMLDDLGQDMDRVDTKLDGVMKKIAKLAHLDDDKKQWKAIIVLSIILFFLVFLLIVL
ncbi:unnamed protein product [Auanema sp. JU1783]|nr:unnamed protein product [Auanema sp. JU1783]